MPRLHLNICLSDIPRDLIRKASNGKSYINLNVTELRETDERGNDHTIYVFVPNDRRFVPTDRREDHPDKVYIGRGKLMAGDGRQQQPAPQQAQPANDNDLPF